jgi:capsid protein
MHGFAAFVLTIAVLAGWAQAPSDSRRGSTSVQRTIRRSPVPAVGFDGYICTWKDGGNAYEAANVQSLVAGDLITGAAADQAQAFADAFKIAKERSVAAGFCEAYEKHQAVLATLAGKSFRSSLEWGERFALGQVRRALYIENARLLARVYHPGTAIYDLKQY